MASVMHIGNGASINIVSESEELSEDRCWLAITWTVEKSGGPEECTVSRHLGRQVEDLTEVTAHDREQVRMPLIAWARA